MLNGALSSIPFEKLDLKSNFDVDLNPPTPNGMTINQ
jgi:hypothetical protein